MLTAAKKKMKKEEAEDAVSLIDEQKQILYLI